MTKSKNFFSKIKNSIKYRFENKLFVQQWFITFSFENNINTKPLKNFVKIIPPNDRFWADPHIVFKENKYYIFFEEFLFQENKGHISYLTINNAGNYSKPTMILEKPFHLSYPFIFEFKNEMYMIPETQTKKSIQLYKCLNFPEKWEFQKNLLTEIDAVDSTIFFYKDKWWMFTGVREDINSGWNNLHLFFTDDPITDNWISHPMNPITKNIGNSRPAGSIFIENGKIYRPAQVSTVDEYGQAIIINKIKTLNEKIFDEEKIKVIEPWEKQIKGIHTMNHVNNLTVIDAKWKIKR